MQKIYCILRMVALFFFSIVVGSITHADVFKESRWYKIKATGQHCEGHDISDSQSTLWVFSSDGRDAVQKTFNRNEIIKEVSFKDAGLEGREVALVKTKHSQEAICTIYRLFEDGELNFFCDELTKTRSGNLAKRLHYKAPLHNTLIELRELYSFKKGDAVTLRQSVGAEESGSTWKIKHIFAVDKVVLEPTYAPMLRSFNSFKGPITNIDNLKIAQ